MAIEINGTQIIDSNLEMTNVVSANIGSADIDSASITALTTVTGTITNHTTENLTINSSAILDSAATMTFRGTTDFSVATAISGLSGRYKGAQVITTLGESQYTPSANVGYAIIELQAPGAGGGNANASGTNDVGGATGGGAGGYYSAIVDTTTFNWATLTLGSPGAGASVAGGDGSGGGNLVWEDSSGTEITVYGGNGGKGQDAISQDGVGATAGALRTQAATIVSGSSLVQTLANAGGEGTLCSTSLSLSTGGKFATSTNGGNSKFGAGGIGAVRTSNGQNTGDDGDGYGSGGSGGVAMGTVSGGSDGGDGAPPIAIIHEFSV